MKVELLGVFGNDLMVANAARISYDRWHDELTERDERLIRKLAKDGHNSPFYHPQAQFRLTAPFFVANQLKRHHVGFAINEVSRRYTSEGITRTLPAVRRQDGGEVDSTWASIKISHAVDIAIETYLALVDDGIAKEVARAVLPMATDTTWLWTGSLYAYAKLCQEREAPAAQKETREVAGLIDDHMYTAFPVSWKALIIRA